MDIYIFFLQIKNNYIINCGLSIKGLQKQLLIRLINLHLKTFGHIYISYPFHSCIELNT